MPPERNYQMEFMILYVIGLSVTSLIIYFRMDYYKKKAYYWYNEQERLICGFIEGKYDKEDLHEMMDCRF